jgi:hypothetical protein
MMMLATGFVHHRYTLIIMPILGASLAALLTRILPGQMSALALVLGCSLLLGGPFKSAEALGLMSASQSQYRPLLERLKASLSPEETLITCRFKMGIDATTWIAPGNLTYYGSDARPIYTLRSAEDLHKQEIERKIRPPYRGLCKFEEFEILKSRLADYSVIEQSNGHVHWRSTAGAASR